MQLLEQNLELRGLKQMLAIIKFDLYGTENETLVTITPPDGQDFLNAVTGPITIL